MANSADPAAWLQDLWGMQGLTGPNTYAPFQGQIPFGGGTGPGVGFMAGWPTDAMGKPIQAPPGMQIGAPSQPATPGTTLNSPPASAGAPVGTPLARAQAMGATPQQLAGMISQMSPTIPGTNQPNPNYTSLMANAAAGAMAPGQPATASASAPAAPAAPATNDAGLTRQQYLSLLANPGNPAMPGAAPPGPGQTPTGTPPPNVMQAFLAANPGSKTGFAKTLGQLA